MKRARKKGKRFWNLAHCMLFYLLVSIISYVLVKEFGLWTALAITAIIYHFIVLNIATILRMRGDITERSFICLVLEGFKAINLFKKIWDDSAGSKPTNSPRAKKS
jgi:hypothetical protein